MSFLTIESPIRLAAFFGILGLMAIWELMAPRRRLAASKPRRWTSNLGLVALNATLLRIVLPMGVVGMASLAEKHHWGLFNYLGWPGWLAVPIAVVALDFCIYLQHVVFHAVPLLWRLHMVHHADLDFDVTTGLRFHTIEILLSLGVKLAAVALLGASAVAVLTFEVLLNATSMFNHSNIRMPLWLDRVVRLLVVTPDMHRVHHSIVARETNSNFGFNLPWWDFLLGTYRAQPAHGHEGMTIGLSQFRDSRAIRLLWMLALPFTGPTGNYPINRRGTGDKSQEPQADEDAERATGLWFPSGRAG